MATSDQQESAMGLQIRSIVGGVTLADTFNSWWCDVGGYVQ